MRIPSLIKLPTLFALAMLTTFFPLNSDETVQSKKPATGEFNGSGDNVILPADLLAALSLAHGDHENLTSREDLFNDLQSVDIVLIGEAHWDQRDMQTAFEMTRILARRRKIALAVERFPLTLQPKLEALNRTESEAVRVEEMRRILQMDGYHAVWRTSHTLRSGAIDSFDSSNIHSPSTEAFEAMMLWAAHSRIPIVGLDLPLSERELGLGEDIPYRNKVWKEQIARFLEANQSDDYLVVAVGGIDHFSNAPDSVQAELRSDPSRYRLLSIGQRDANYATKALLQIENLAATHGINDLIVQTPQFAVVFQSGTRIFPTPPDYWIPVHSVDSWED